MRPRSWRTAAPVDPARALLDEGAPQCLLDTGIRLTKTRARTDEASPPQSPFIAKPDGEQIGQPPMVTVGAARRDLVDALNLIGPREDVS